MYSDLFLDRCVLSLGKQLKHGRFNDDDHGMAIFMHSIAVIC